MGLIVTGQLNVSLKSYEIVTIPAADAWVFNPHQMSLEINGCKFSSDYNDYGSLIFPGGTTIKSTLDKKLTGYTIKDDKKDSKLFSRFISVKLTGDETVTVPSNEFWRVGIIGVKSLLYLNDDLPGAVMSKNGNDFYLPGGYKIKSRQPEHPQLLTGVAFKALGGLNV